ncbi:MAG: gamma-glutamylcyclotransferase [Acidiferrobacterales bacterium]|nr:gamma-glutamylcyclotransferase [Acidiferrobacterales bacterium]
MNLFVYGTLAPGEANEHVLKELKGTWQKGSVRGQLFQSGWGAAMGFPGIVLNPDGDEVGGQLFSSIDLKNHWSELDAFEGEGYNRVLTTVRLKNGDSVKAYIYELSDKGQE